VSRVVWAKFTLHLLKVGRWSGSRRRSTISSTNSLIAARATTMSDYHNKRHHVRDVVQSGFEEEEWET
jgi:hypothetical protein